MGTALVLVVVFNAFFLASGLGSSAVANAAAASRGSDDDGIKIYIVFTARQPAPETLSESAARARIESFHHGLLSDALDDGGGGGSGAPERVVYHYTRSLHGFAARLTQREKNKLAAMDDVLSIHEKATYHPRTTRSWDFLGLPRHNDPKRLLFEKDVIIGMVDSGVWPESESFSDSGLPPPPAKWKGVCSSNFTACNNKIIGARAYKDGVTTLSPRDDDGHGTHTASTAAGRAVPGASMGGFAGGTARSAVPGARLAIYKVCWGDDGCSTADILMAFDDAVADGVDVLSASVGSDFPADYADDLMAVGAFHAMRRGVVTSVAAGNDGPRLGAVTNVAPWVHSVAASTTDRRIVSDLVLLGHGKTISGSSINVFPGIGGRSVLIDPGACGQRELKGKNYKGAILLCGGQSLNEESVHATGADGAIQFRHNTDTAFSFAVPAVRVTKSQYEEIMDYYNSTRLALVSIRNSQARFDATAPRVGFFSSRGPNMITPGILKPDISAPGVDILAAWPESMSVSGSAVDDRQLSYNIISGTSMACPHVTGAAAYVKSVHPDWSPAAVMSALITTATPMSASSTPEAELAYGAGQVNPLHAPYPGLIYDAGEDDYLGLLCAQGYNVTQIATMAGGDFVCPEDGRGSVANLNYPSIAVPILNYGVRFAVDVPRTVTNVGPDDSVYHANVTSVPGIAVSVTPHKLAFSSTEKMNFTVRVSGWLAPVEGTLGASASIVWSDGRHQVRSPIYVFPLSATRG
ncbi:subtilisin-like protease SBT4.9 isoform X1 [Brachypodium distachyon]|uniref:Subtilisin-like protease n=1 Tax=Brachypodium distachyon TaxID=15368 RepID=I1H2I1_BRADI|nr:subtilisin-like protease SBT4.9 isoform X1 [Brachypodium distachyon]KQK20294.1 hypothetical protein BRADI_1g53630v3 [Brachypodium distachyon]PNT76791.1 hypothetical protein BRADI_1g53630v3 [Brachypodium distachyon]PNT76793.1 hypothetical protein BRADI_1g53630v3 [Brachypodium distachyon]|eukprot:XP_003561281.1 subtilisin-like protease SBT4.9 isoform X1 [Brachypodium distachyon]